MLLVTISRLLNNLNLDCSENGNETSRTAHVRELTNWKYTGQWYDCLRELSISLLTELINNVFTGR